MDGKPAGVVEAKKEGQTLSGFEIQTEKYSVGLPDELRPYRKPLPFCYQSTGIETRLSPDMQRVRDHVLGGAATRENKHL